MLCSIMPLKSEELSRATCIVSYNVESLFSPAVDSLNTDTEFTPDGSRHWNGYRYKQKIAHIAQVLTAIGQWDGVDIVGLCEVESRECVDDLCQALQRGNYQALHHDSPDKRGIDVALLYRKGWEVVAERAIRVDLGEENSTRDILYAALKKADELGQNSDTLHILVCHLPSMSGGAAATQWKRERALKVLQTAVDSVKMASADAKIVVMGDMNSAPQENLTGLINRMIPMVCCPPYGTEKYHGQWTYLDQFYLTENLQVASVSVFAPDWLLEEDTRYLGDKPKRTYMGYRWQNGYSDHLPIVLRIHLR